jgi:hypothetical protein
MSGLLSRALRSPSVSSLQQYASAQSLVEIDMEAQQDELELSSGGLDDSVHSVNGGLLQMVHAAESQSHSADDETLLFGFEDSGAELNAVASAGLGHR